MKNDEFVQEAPQPDPQLSEFVWFTTAHDYHGYHNYVNIHPIILPSHAKEDTETDYEEKEPDNEKMLLRL